jgi:hypothetical protein
MIWNKGSIGGCEEWGLGRSPTQEVPSELSGNEIGIVHWRTRLLWTPKMGESRLLVRLYYILGSPGWCPSGIMDYTTGIRLSPVSLQLFLLTVTTISIDCQLFRNECVSCFSLLDSLLGSKWILSFRFLSPIIQDMIIWMSGNSLHNARLDTN